ncbi:hypothetical protein ACFL29_00080 [Patescibacteria group bacterium]
MVISDEEKRLNALFRIERKFKRFKYCFYISLIVLVIALCLLVVAAIEEMPAMGFVVAGGFFVGLASLFLFGVKCAGERIKLDNFWKTTSKEFNKKYRSA